MVLTSKWHLRIQKKLHHPLPQNDTGFTPPGSNSSKWEEFYSQGNMGIGWDELGDLKQCPSKEAMKTKMKELYGAEYSYIRIRLLPHGSLLMRSKSGDIVYAKKGMRKVIGRGIVESDYIFDTQIAMSINIFVKSNGHITGSGNTRDKLS
jgi:predicted Mrr-cat superfamily restriction endonuclease